MTMLDNILAEKKREIAQRKQETPIPELEKSVFFSRNTHSLRNSITGGMRAGVIAEFKRASPSRGLINANASITEVASGYCESGASAISVLTDSPFFAGSLEDLATARECTDCPILRKDFIIDPYQIIEAKAFGADAILLIARALTPQRAYSLKQLAKSLGLEALLEIHSKDDLNTLDISQFDLVGINRRDLATFKTEREDTSSLIKELSKESIIIAESGIQSALEAFKLKESGCSGFLIGELFMREDNPEKACAEFVSEVMRLYGVSNAAA